MDVNGKVAIVTGASSGIGLATTQLLAAIGAKVVIAARSKDKLEALAKELKESKIAVSVVYPYITATDFEKNTLTNSTGQEKEEAHGPFPADSAGYVAEKILEAIEKGEAEIFAHDWMKERRS